MMSGGSKVFPGNPRHACFGHRCRRLSLQIRRAKSLFPMDLRTSVNYFNGIGRCVLLGPNVFGLMMRFWELHCAPIQFDVHSGWHGFPPLGKLHVPRLLLGPVLPPSLIYQLAWRSWRVIFDQRVRSLPYRSPWYLPLEVICLFRFGWSVSPILQMVPTGAPKVISSLAFIHLQSLIAHCWIWSCDQRSNPRPFPTSTPLGTRVVNDRDPLGSH